VKEEGEGDRIFNGANDDGSGTVSVIELANALAKTNPHPKRSILFMTFFGEEKGLLGSRYYGSHPLIPLKDTIAQVNLEQLGRTDDPAGPQVGTATFTGFGFSDIPATFQAAGQEVGVKVYNNEKNGDSFFARSDNQSLADAGIPAHTIGVAFEFPDYHGVGDEWPKIDYDNMAKVNRMIALGLLHLANNPKLPQWNESNPKTEKYVSAWKALHKE
jgi:Zn-dependent M28 family amino/carboxypeptidase